MPSGTMTAQSATPARMSGNSHWRRYVRSQSRIGNNLRAAEAKPPEKFDIIRPTATELAGGGNRSSCLTSRGPNQDPIASDRRGRFINCAPYGCRFLPVRCPNRSTARLGAGSQRAEGAMSARSPQTNSSFFRMVTARGDGVLVQSFMIKRPSVSQRMAGGKALRKQVPRAAQAVYEKRADRPDPVEILERQSTTRVRKLVPVRYGRMLANPFAFLRGSAAVMASDLSRLPTCGTRVAACGDSHVKNFGVYVSAERNLVFSINDFDEVYVGAWEWDLKRLAASAAVATRFMGGD